MQNLVFKTASGAELYFDTTTGQYESTDWLAVDAALKADMDNYEVDPYAAKMAFDLEQDIIAKERLADTLC